MYMMNKLWELQVRVDGGSYWLLLVGVFGDRYRLALQVGAVGWSCRLKLLIRVGQSYVGWRCWPGMLAGVVVWSYWLQVLIGVIGCNYWSEKLVGVFDLRCWLGLLVRVVGQSCGLELVVATIGWSC